MKIYPKLLLKYRLQGRLMNIQEKAKNPESNHEDSFMISKASILGNQMWWKHSRFAWAKFGTQKETHFRFNPKMRLWRPLWEQVTSEGSRSSILYGDYQLLLFAKWGIDKWILLHFVFVCLRPCRGFICSKGGTLLKGSFQISSVIKFNVNTLGFDAYK